MPVTTTLTLFRYRGFANAFWAFSQMGLAPRRLKDVPGMSFYKLLGTGSAGFSTWPDWSVYGLLQVWDAPEAAMAFFDTHPQMQAFQKRSVESLRIFMHPVRSKGVWNGRNPFVPSDETTPTPGVTAVLTRATIKKRFLRRFWSYVPRSQEPLSGAKGLIFSKGVGETPFIDMATFSLWESAEDMQAYAYGSEAHLGAIRRTRELGWYREELFARFRPYRIEGSWEGIRGLDNFKEKLRNRG